MPAHQAFTIRRLAMAALLAAFAIGALADDSDQKTVLTGKVEVVLGNGRSIMFRAGNSKKLREIQFSDQCKLTGSDGKPLAAGTLKIGQQATVTINSKTQVAIGVEIKTDKAPVADTPRRLGTRRVDPDQNLPLQDNVELRNWKPNDGQLLIEGRCVGVVNGHVLIQRRNGSCMYIPATNLSEEDQEYVGTRLIDTSLVGRKLPSDTWKLLVTMTDGSELACFANLQRPGDKSRFTVLVEKDGLVAPQNVDLDRLKSVEVLEPFHAVAQYDAHRKKFVTDGQVVQQNRPGKSGRYTGGRYAGSYGRRKHGSNLDRILAATFFHCVGKTINSKGSILGAVLSQLALKFRDDEIQAALASQFPNLTTLELDLVKDVITLALDGELTAGNLAKEVTKDVIIDTLKQKNPQFGAVAEVADFIYKVHKAHKGN